MTDIYEATDLTPMLLEIDTSSAFSATDTTAEFEGFAFWYLIMHSHGAVIPGGAINGVNTAYTVVADQLEVILNGLHVTFTVVEGGFTLDTAPTAGDILWCEVIID